MFLFDERQNFKPEGVEKELEFRDFEALEIKSRWVGGSQNLSQNLKGNKGRVLVSNTKDVVLNFLKTFAVEIFCL